MLKSSRVKDLTLTSRINSLKQEFEIEGWILGVGDSEEDDVGYFYNQLHTVLKKGFPIAIVPTHDPAEPNWGLVKLVRRLSTQGRIDASSCLVRSETIIQQHKCKENALNRRDTNRHLKTIRVKNEALINSKVVLLLDDIVTTGTSLMACKKLLLDAGASEVISLALGKAT
jgi:predicted amidophosphoribosyltransferase